MIWATKFLVPTTVTLEPCIRLITFHEDRLALGDPLALRRVISSSSPSPTAASCSFADPFGPFEQTGEAPFKHVTVAHKFHSQSGAVVWALNSALDDSQE